MGQNQDSVRDPLPDGCNLQGGELQSRYVFGWVGVVLTVLLAVYLLTQEAPRLARLWLFFPAFLGALGLLQGTSRFCVVYGILGVPGDENKPNPEIAPDSSSRRKRNPGKAFRLLALAGVIAFAITAVVYVFPQ